MLSTLNPFLRILTGMQLSKTFSQLPVVTVKAMDVVEAAEATVSVSNSL